MLWFHMVQGPVYTHTCQFSPQVNLLWPPKLISTPAISRFLGTSFGILPPRNVVDLAQAVLTSSSNLQKCLSLPAPEFSTFSEEGKGYHTCKLELERPCLPTPKPFWTWAFQSQWAILRSLSLQAGYLSSILKPYVVTHQECRSESSWESLVKKRPARAPLPWSFYLEPIWPQL